MKVLQYSHLLCLSMLNIFPDDNTECHLFYSLFYNEIQENKFNIAICERVYIRPGLTGCSKAG